MEILIIEHNYKYKQFPYLFWESRLVNEAGQYVKISSQNTTQANAFQAVCPKDKDGDFIPTHIVRRGENESSRRYKVPARGI